MNPSATDPKQPADAAQLEAYNEAVDGRDAPAGDTSDTQKAAADPHATDGGGSNATPVASNSSNYGASAIDTP